MSRWHVTFASIIGALGIRCEVESLSDGGYFSVDVVLPDHDVAIEFDGPFHFIDTSDGGEGQGLTLVHFSAQLEPCLTHKKNPPHLRHPLTPP
jgi:hypothetical protein